ncbi:hypothetical protein E5F05_11535 [Deinococcus metallilatus]|uniref:Uncharacterized protein n=1 Tax=Deinococcus metallilatus TaxID=1211322 RepID=A0AAJ5F1W3_9DEIO|nr:hypothetical protein [Deinococcus metallilatus]MBB5295334.1 hypothetical protein [Deinococcus metallilatus]QBY08513.1 hypothetical protein E5F05_11535 [Deinococcus metallilatus]RXJ11023.1 hypothetical protein ERJ73_10355 [Deinococcus metallilatus]TLK21599.1 hypothetical protein FCS05_18955 [Deinococcus metallilatus]GMA15109.1 hypothetical protein GCM10025871_14400 [Deinococcus metallilatus]
MTYWAELVELYEYRVADTLAGRVPRGGRRALTDLWEVLLAAPLDPALQRRLLESERQYRAHLRRGREESGPPAPPSPASQPTPPGWTAPVLGDTPEARAWEELRQLAWFAVLRARLLHLGQTLQAEPERLSLRVLYAVVENADRDARGVAEELAVPAADDPLASLRDPDVVRDLMLALASGLFRPEGRKRLRGALATLHEVPFPRHADEDVLTARLQAADREPLAPEAREALREALRAASPPARDPRERPAIRGAAERLQQTLEALLADAPAPVSGLMPARSILYAAHPEATLPAPDDGAAELVIHLGGGQAARWRGLDLRWHPVGPNWQVQVGGQVALLRPDRPPAERVLTLLTAPFPLRLALSGAYLLLHPEGPPAEQLGQLATHARAAARLLDPGGQHANLRLARAAAQMLQGGRVDAAVLGPASAEKYRQASPETLLTFARKGVGALVARLTRLTPQEAEAALRASADALGLPPQRARALHDVLHAAAFTSERVPSPQPLTHLTLPGDGTFASVTLGDEPVTLTVAGHTLTLRAEHPGVSVLLPGQPPVPMPDLLVLPVPGARVLLIRQGTWLAAAEVRETGDEDGAAR